MSLSLTTSPLPFPVPPCHLPRPCPPLTWARRRMPYASQNSQGDNAHHTHTISTPYPQAPLSNPTRAHLTVCATEFLPCRCVCVCVSLSHSPHYKLVLLSECVRACAGGRARAHTHTHTFTLIFTPSPTQHTTHSRQHPHEHGSMWTGDTGGQERFEKRERERGGQAHCRCVCARACIGMGLRK